MARIVEPHVNSLHLVSLWYTLIDDVMRGSIIVKLNSTNQQLEIKLTAACELIERRLAAIWSAVDAVDTKINIALGFASGILVLLAGFYSLGLSEWPIVSHVSFALALVAYIILVILGLLAYRVRVWSYRPDPAEFVKHCTTEEYDLVQLKKWVADECILSCRTNLDGLNKKALLANWLLILLALQTILTVFGLAYAVIIIK